MPETYYIRIKKEYAVSVIEDFQKMDAVELLTDQNTDIPDWQMELGRKELENITSGNTELKPWSESQRDIKF